MSERTLGQAMADYLEHLKSEGKSERTIYTYSRDIEQIIGFFGTDRKLTSILTPHVGKFLKSDALLKLPNGNERAEPTVRKTVRVLRTFFVWARDNGYIDKLPLPKDVPLGRCADNSENAATRNASRQCRGIDWNARWKRGERRIRNVSATVPIPAASVRYAIEHYGGGSPQTVIWLASAASALLKRKPRLWL